MEHLIQIINRIYEILICLQGIARGKREELVDDYKYNFNTLVELIINLERIVAGETPYGRPIKWGYHLWQLHTCKRQHGLTLQAGWDDVVDFGITLGRIVKVAVPKGCRFGSSILTSLGQEHRSDTVCGVCELNHIPQLQRLALREAVVEISSQSSLEGGSTESDESETVHFDLDNLSTEELESSSDSVPDLIDHMGMIVGGSWRTRIRRARARARTSRLHLPIGRAQTWRDFFRPPHPEREGQPWREVLGFMVDEQQDMTFGTN